MRKHDMPAEDELTTIDVRQYSLIDYPQLKDLYVESGFYDPETDSEERLLSKVEQNPDSILVAFDENEELVGSVSFIEDGRIAIIFRLVARKSDEKEFEHMVRMMLLHYVEQMLREYGYNEIHVMAPDADKLSEHEYEHYGFTKGNPYRWFWKKITQEEE